MKLYSIKDVGSGFTQVITANNNYDAKRILTGIVNGQPSLISQYPKDFSLYSLGELNQDTGVVSPCTEFICEASDLVKDKQQEQATTTTK